MSECDTRKRILNDIYWKLYSKIDMWQKGNPVEKMDYFREILFHKSDRLDLYQSYIHFTPNENGSFVKNCKHVKKYVDDDYDYYRCRNFSLTVDPRISYPVMLLFYTNRYTHGYYLKSDFKTFKAMRNKKDLYYHREFCDYAVIDIIKSIMNLDYNRYNDTFTLGTL